MKGIIENISIAYYQYREEHCLSDCKKVQLLYQYSVLLFNSMISDT
jgi:hypothetical protein